MVDPEHELIFISERGQIMRTPVRGVSSQGRPTQGINLMDVYDGDKVAAVAVIDMSKEYAVEDLPTGAEPEPETNGAKPSGRGRSNGKTKK
jgi:DNA gyrase subunit A